MMTLLVWVEVLQRGMFPQHIILDFTTIEVLQLIAGLFNRAHFLNTIKVENQS